MPGISIIVPFNNIAGFARRCVEPLLAQTLPPGELLLVDDGSTDGTAELLDAYADGERVRVLRKGNGGPSDARNFGIARCRCEFVSFVDGDDIVSPRYVESLSVALAGALAAGSERPLVIADGAVVGARQVDGFAFSRPNAGCAPQVLALEEAVTALCRDGLRCTAWAKVGPRAMYEQAPFPQGKVYEDWHVVGRHVAMADCIVHVPETLYGHVMRSGSITNRHGSLRDAADYLEAIAAFEESIAGMDLADAGARPFFRCLQLARVFACLEGAALRPADPDALARIRAFYPGVDSAGACREAVRAEIAVLLPGVLADPLVPRAAKARFRLLVSSARLYEAAFRGYGALVKGVRR